MQKLSDRGLVKLREFEGERLTAYLDSAQVWTIGFGHTANVRPGDRISHEQAERFLFADIIVAERCVRTRVTVDLNQNQFDALVSFVFNVGCGAFGRSTLLKLLNAGDHRAAAKQFPHWRKGGGRVLRGLVNRRAAEQALFMEEI